MTWVAVLLGGALGTAARHAVNVATTTLSGGGTGSYATALVNTTGTFIIGMLAGAVASGRLTMGSTTRAFVFVGLLGGFTTFSTYMLDTLTLMQEGAAGRALLNLFGQIVIGVGLIYLGYRAGQAL